MLRASLAVSSDLDVVLGGGGVAGQLARAVDWATTPLGPVTSWSQALRSTASLVLHNDWGMLLWWGPDLVQIYNDAYVPVLGNKHPRAMGQSVRECWREVFHIIGPMIDRPYRGGPATVLDDLDLLVDRRTPREEAHFRIAYSPVIDDTVPGTRVGGVLAIVTETTEQVYSGRQLTALRELAARAGDGVTAEAACQIALAILDENKRDVPFAACYLLEAPIHDPRVREAIDDNVARVIDIDDGHTSPFSDPVRQAIVLPLGSPGTPYGALVCGISPHRSLDSGYRGFFELIAGQVSTAIRNARALEYERKRAEALAEIDRAKTTFFSNVSHEFRTPLTLILGPLEDALAHGSLDGAALEAVHRNAVRLLKLVNSLLDFARIEAGRVEASFEPVDLGRSTTELASVFRAAIEHAGLRLEIHSEPLEPVFVDRDMWEKVVLNLLSNALKFTFEGAISVDIRGGGDRAIVTVSDTGIGIAPHELPQVFERFHRIENVRARSHEGSGIGLAMLHELIRIHHGTIEVASELGRGTTFTISLPFGSAHLSAERIRVATPVSAASSFLHEAASWTAAPAAAQPSSDTRILVVDDNPDMRAYVSRLLAERWVVEAVENGAVALASIAAQPPALVLTDVMMPMTDGFELLAAIRDSPATRGIPVIMLSARAGEESRIDGLEAGADDYLIKPFSARELVARVATHLELRRVRTELERFAHEAAEANHAKDDFIAMLGHELRNPLAPMLTALELMHLRGVESREQEVLERQVRHLARLVDDLLDVSRVARGKVELHKRSVELADIVLRAVELAGPLIEQRRNHLDLRISRTGFGVLADPDRMAQVISNLLTNAAKYSSPSTKIVVEAARAGDRVQLRVTDQGYGIAPEMLDRVFDLFVQQRQTIDRAHGGLGIGLAIARNLVELHGGTIRAESAGLGKGSVFTIELAAAEVPPREQPGRTRPITNGQLRAVRILVVDDNLDVVDMLGGALQSLGYAVETAHDGPSAIEKARRFHPNIALLDLGLPVMDGYELAQRLREEHGGRDAIHLVAVSGYGQDSDRRRAAEAGFARHLVKPVDLGTLATVVKGLRS